MSKRKTVICRYRARKNGKRGATVTLPSSWLEDTGIKPGDRLSISRDSEDRLVIEPSKEPTK